MVLRIGLGFRTGDWNWEFALEIRDSYLRLGLRIGIGDLHWDLEIGIEMGIWIEIGIQFENYF